MTTEEEKETAEVISEADETETEEKMYFARGRMSKILKPIATAEDVRFGSDMWVAMDQYLYEKMIEFAKECWYRAKLDNRKAPSQQNIRDACDKLGFDPVNIKF